MKKFILLIIIAVMLAHHVFADGGAGDDLVEYYALSVPLIGGEIAAAKCAHSSMLSQEYDYKRRDCNGLFAMALCSRQHYDEESVIPQTATHSGVVIGREWVSNSNERQTRRGITLCYSRSKNTFPELLNATCTVINR
jgi:hypothetical protein